MTLFDPRIEKHLIADQGEVVIDEVRKHWAAVVSAALELFGGTVVLLLVFFVPEQAWWVPFVLGGAVVLHALWRILERHTDRFVITNMRVFRVHGILSQRIAIMPLSRILDISVHKPMIGRILGYGHFVFESAAQEQGLREIRFVGDPDARGITIQRVIAQAGLRGSAARQAGLHAQFPAFAPGEARMADPRPPLPPLPPLPSLSASTASSVTPTVEWRPSSDPDAHRGWGWLADAQRREDERLAHLRGDPLPAQERPFDPDRTTTAPLDLPR